MISYLPNVSSNAEGFNSLAALAATAAADPGREVQISFANLSWFDANMAAPLGAVIARLTDALKAVSLVEIAAPQVKILSKNGFLAAFGYAAVPDNNRTTMPYRRFKLTDMGLFGDYLLTHLPGKGMPSMTSDFALAFQQSLFEVFANAVTHSESAPGVFVCGQFFPIDRRLDISIADAGVGIPHKVTERLRPVLKSDPELLRVLQDANLLDAHAIFRPSAALSLALSQGFTTKTGKTPGGAGLKLLKRFIQLNGGSVQIASGAALWHYSRGQDKFHDLPFAFPGTVVNFEVNTADAKSYCLAPVSP